MGLKVLIVGGVAGGASAAARLRRIDESAQIILFEKGEFISYANCGLPYYIGDVIKEKEKLLVQTPEAMRQRFNIDVRVNSEVLSIDRANKTVEVLDHAQNRRYTESYDKLVLSPGAQPARPPIPGIDHPNIFTLRTVPDTYRIRDFVDEKSPRHAVIVGAGFIGLELAENLAERGVKVSIVELAGHVIAQLDQEMAAIVQEHLVNKGMALYLNNSASAFEDDGGRVKVRLSGGETLTADLVLMGVGVRPQNELAAAAGLEIGPSRGIVVDETLRTADPDIYAVGDAIEVKDFVTGRGSVIPLAGPANKQGRMAADNILGAQEHFAGTQGTAIVKVFDLTAAVTGAGEQSLRRAGIEYEKSFTYPASHAGYYPGALPMTIKLLFTKDTGKLLGAQIVGYEGVDKRIDVLATALRAGMTVFDLGELELAYAPPYSSAKDPVNLAGFAAGNILKGDTQIFHWDAVAALDRNQVTLLDVRTPAEYALGTIDGATNIPLDELRQRAGEIDPNKPVYLFCQVGLRGYLAARILTQHGFEDVHNLSGGYRLWKAAAKPFPAGIGSDRQDGGEEKKSETPAPTAKLTLDACGLQCPGPILKVYQAVAGMKDGETVEVTATDPAFAEDVKVWCRTTGNTLLSSGWKDGAFYALIRREPKAAEPEQKAPRSHDKSMIVFSNDLDRAIASFIIANGSAAMGRKVTMFFTFWGLNILRRADAPAVKKNFIEKMFGMMMPRGSLKLSLSKMNMAGAGPKLIRYLMHKKEILSLEDLIENARKAGVRFVACNMSMDIMGIKREELLDGVEIGGVASFLGSAEDSDMSLFI